MSMGTMSNKILKNATIENCRKPFNKPNRNICPLLVVCVNENWSVEGGTLARFEEKCWRVNSVTHCVLGTE